MCSLYFLIDNKQEKISKTKNLLGCKVVCYCGGHVTMELRKRYCFWQENANLFLFQIRCTELLRFICIYTLNHIKIQASYLNKSATSNLKWTWYIYFPMDAFNAKNSVSPGRGNVSKARIPKGKRLFSSGGSRPPSRPRDTHPVNVADERELRGSHQAIV
jgi:hypothetical protein